MGFTYAAMDFDKGQRSMVAWYFMFSICFLSASRSIFARILSFCVRLMGERRESREQNCYVFRYLNTTERVSARERTTLLPSSRVLHTCIRTYLGSIVMCLKEREAAMLVGGSSETAVQGLADARVQRADDDGTLYARQPASPKRPLASPHAPPERDR